MTAVQTAGAVVAEAAGEIGRAAAEEAMDPYRDKPDIDPDDWMFILANPWNEIGDYTPELTTLERQQFDVRIVDDMEAFVQHVHEIAGAELCQLCVEVKYQQVVDPGGA